MAEATWKFINKGQEEPSEGYTHDGEGDGVREWVWLEVLHMALSARRVAPQEAIKSRHYDAEGNKSEVARRTSSVKFVSQVQMRVDRVTNKFSRA